MALDKMREMKYKFGQRFYPRVGKVNKYAPQSTAKLKNVELFPKLPNGEPHPMPYYKTEDTFDPVTDPPWKEDAEREEKEQMEEMMNDPRHPGYFRDTILQETVDEEIMAIVSSVLSKIKHKESRDTYAFSVMEDDILVPTIQREVFVSVWELLYEWGRDLTHEEFKTLSKRKAELTMDRDSVDSLRAHMFEGREWSDDLSEEKSLSFNRWDVLLYNYHLKLQQKSFETNVALQMAQETVIIQAATDVIMDSVLETLMTDMTVLDEKEKLQTPPRVG